MKTKFSLCGVIAFMAITVFLIAGCDNGTTDSGTPAPKTPIAGDFTVGNLTQYADNVTAVTVEPKTGKSGGTVTVYYDGSEILPTAEGEYMVTFDVAAADGWNAATGLAGGTLTVIPPGQAPGDPVADDFDIDNLNQTADYITAVTITPKSGKSEGSVTVYYDGSEILPTAEGEYTVTFDVAAATGWNAAVGLDGGTLTIIPPGQTLEDILEEIAAYLSAADGGESAENPVCLLVNIDLEYMPAGDSGWQQLLNTINNADKFIALDLSLCEMTGTAFNPVSSISTGKDKIVSITLPAAAKGITNGSSSDPTFNNFDSLTIVSGAYITSIGNNAFYNCSSLTGTSFPLAESIGYEAFFECSSLTEVSFPLAESIGGYAFYGCSGLTEASMIKVKLFPKEYFFF